MRVSPPRVFPTPVAAVRPPLGSPAADAYRQTGFVLGGEVETILAGLAAEGEMAAASADAKHRTQLLAAAMGVWSRAWLCRLQALHAIQAGNYAAALPLIRAAADCQAAETALLESDAGEWRAWLEEGGIAQAPADHATEYRLHAFRSGEALARHEDLGELYRAVTDLALPHFGATLLLAGSDSTPERVLITFGDRDFHLGLAELGAGWLARLALSQAATLLAHPDVFNVAAPAALEEAAAAARALVARPDRCRMEAVQRGGERRYLMHEWRRTPGATPKRLLL
ncbi:MAG: hypothetical protein IT304_12125 [Dehalococcoidia bacterium]|nr:hypothetical protein [Dehalococcoidia bacterium]